MTHRVRFAPSPTGYLHIGGARTALFNWIFAKKNQGTFVLRIEDTDPERSKREHEEQICRDLTWLGLDWQEGPTIGGDFGPYRQSDRFAIYDTVIEKLLAEGKAYRCTATTEELEELRAGQKDRGEKIMYDNRYRDANLGPDCGEHVIRLKTPLDGETIVDDKIKGEAIFQNAEIDDFILRRSDGAPTYNFVCVVDDIAMGITLVLRGDDHLNNTPKQILLYQALQAPCPAFAHVPMILGDDGKRLSKRHGATAVGMYEEMGILKEALFNYLTRLGWACGDMEIFSATDVIDVFDVSQINTSGAKWDMQKLLWVNQQWIMKLELEDVAQRMVPFMHKAGLGDTLTTKHVLAIKSMKERAQTLVELAEKIQFYFVEEEQFERDTHAVEKALQQKSVDALSSLTAFLETIPAEEYIATNLEKSMHTWGEGYTALQTQQGKKFKLSQVFFPVRIALCGVGGGPELFDVMEILGKEKTLFRMQSAIETCKNSPV